MTQDEIIEITNRASKEWLRELPSPEETANQVPKRFLEIFAKLVAAKTLAELESQEPVAVKRMKEWVEFLKRQSDNGQHMNIPSGLSAGTCWEIAIELEQFINTTPPQRTEERNFCSRCGKRTADLTTIHTCTPPKEGT